MALGFNYMHDLIHGSCFDSFIIMAKGEKFTYMSISWQCDMVGTGIDDCTQEVCREFHTEYFK